jgi:hypothetical protein
MVHLRVFEESLSNSENEEGGTIVQKWSIHISLNQLGWQKLLADYTGRIMKNADNQPRCWHCKYVLILRSRGSDGGQFFGCSGYPKCTGTATILQYGVQMDGFASNGNGSKTKTAMAGQSP